MTVFPRGGGDQWPVYARRPYDTATATSRKRRLGRRHPHLPKIRSAEPAQPAAAGRGRGLGGLRAPAGLRRPARADRRGAGAGHPHRSRPDCRTGPQPGCPDGDAAGAETENPANLRDQAAWGKRRRSGSGNRPNRSSPRRRWPSGSARRCRRSSSTTWSGSGICSKRNAAGWPENCSAWFRCWARSIRSTSWRPSTPLPAARP